jgi:hypothetical protein
MAAILTHKCPHCLTEHIALTVVSSWEQEQGVAALALRCPKCKKPSAANMLPVKSGFTAAGSIEHQSGDVTALGWKLFQFWPDAPGPNIPRYLPKDVARIYLQAERNFPTNGNEEAAGTMYRKALDIGLKKIDPSLTGMLGARIKKLAAAGKLTSDIAVWSDNVRDVGNDAAHEDDPITRDELIVLRNFSEMVLRYLFTLPAMVKKRRGEKIEWETEEGA